MDILREMIQNDNEENDQPVLYLENEGKPFALKPLLQGEEEEEYLIYTVADNIVDMIGILIHNTRFGAVYVAGGNAKILYPADEEQFILSAMKQALQQFE